MKKETKKEINLEIYKAKLHIQLKIVATLGKKKAIDSLKEVDMKINKKIMKKPIIFS